MKISQLFLAHHQQFLIKKTKLNIFTVSRQKAYNVKVSVLLFIKLKIIIYLKYEYFELKKEIRNVHNYLFIAVVSLCQRTNRQ